WSILTLPMGEPIALSLNPCLSSSDLNSATCRSVRSRTFVLWIDRSSMWRTPQLLRTSICSWGSGEISSAKAERVNMMAPTNSGFADDDELHLVGQERSLAGGEADLHLAHGPVPAHLGDAAVAIR